MNILLVRPRYPDVKNEKGNILHHKYFPIGLFKLSTFFKGLGYRVDFVIGTVVPSFLPDRIYITTLFTYWREQLVETIDYYRFLFPQAEIYIGGIDATLNSEELSMYGVLVNEGIMPEVENLRPDYSYLDSSIDFQVIHATRGCIRACAPCGAHKIDGVQFTYKRVEDIEKEIFMNKIVFYDNNLLAHPHVKDLFKMISKKLVNGKVINKVESKSGFDARILVQDWNDTLASGGRVEDTMAYLIKKARFINPRVAWDNWLQEEAIVEKAIEIFQTVGYNKKDIQVFMIYNFILTYDQMEYKRKKCMEWNVQIADCRYRPLNSTYDNYDAKKEQTSKDYFIHPGWTDALVKRFRKSVRGQNIIVRFLAKDRPLRLDIFRKNNVPDNILKEFCRKYPWQDNEKDMVHEAVNELMSA